MTKLILEIELIQDEYCDGCFCLNNNRCGALRKELVEDIFPEFSEYFRDNNCPLKQKNVKGE